mgnify:CR=1 FL=1
MDFFARLESVLFCEDIDFRYGLFMDLYEDFCAKKTTLNHSETINTDFAYFSPCEIVEPSKIHRHHAIKSTTSLAKTLHSVAHIEFCAISLALDSAYRFRHLPKKYYADWLGVANEEFRHFFLLRDLLGEIGFGYGDFRAHFGLYEAMSATGENLIYRMGVVHRGLEAKGLDANPFVREKLLETPRPINVKISAVLEEILRDEIGHVSKGSKWWAFANATNKAQKHTIINQTKNQKTNHNNKETNFSKEFLGVCEKFSEFVLAGKVLNTQARLQSGFSKEECEQIDRFYQKRFAK